MRTWIWSFDFVTKSNVDQNYLSRILLCNFMCYVLIISISIFFHFLKTQENSAKLARMCKLISVIDSLLLARLLLAKML